MAHSFKHSLQKEILHRSSLAALATSFLLYDSLNVYNLQSSIGYNKNLKEI